MNARPKIRVAFGCYRGFNWSKRVEDTFLAQAASEGRTALFNTGHTNMGWIIAGYPAHRALQSLRFRNVDVLVVPSGYEQIVRSMLQNAENNRTVVVPHDETAAARDKRKQILRQVMTAAGIQRENE